MLHRRFFDGAAQAENDFELDPHSGRFGGALAGANDLKRRDLLALLFEDEHHVGGGAGAERQQHHFHGSGGLVRIPVGIEGHGVARGARAQEFLIPNPLDGCTFHRCFLTLTGTARSRQPKAAVPRASQELRESSEAASMMGLGSCRIARTKAAMSRGSNCVLAQRSSSLSASSAVRPFL